MRTWLTTVSLCLLLSSSAFAQADAKAAREHYKRGTTLYDLGRYEDAIGEFQQAYEIKDEPVLLYNIAQAYRLSNKFKEALQFYRTYLRRSPRAPNREEVEQKIADMEGLIQQQAKVATSPSVDTMTPKPPIDGKPPEPPAETKPPETTMTPPKPPEPPPAPPKPPEPPVPGAGMMKGGIALAAVGALTAIGGVVVGVMAMGKSSDQEKAMVFSPSTQSSGKTYQTVGLVLDIGGAVLATSGVVVAILGAKKKAAATPPPYVIAPVLNPNAVGAALSVDF